MPICPYIDQMQIRFGIRCKLEFIFVLRVFENAFGQQSTFDFKKNKIKPESRVGKQYAHAQLVRLDEIQFSIRNSREFSISRKL